MSPAFWNFRGLMARNGQRFVRISYNDRTAYIPQHLCIGKQLIDLLAIQGLIVTGTRSEKNLFDNISSISAFEPAHIIASPGFIDGRFTLGDGSVIGPEADDLIVAFTKNTHVAREIGTLKGWRNRIAQPIGDQHIPMMAVLFAFAAPLAAMVRHPMCRSIEFVGTAASGVGLLPILLASVAGAPTLQMLRFEQVVNGQVPPFHTDTAVPVVGTDAFMAGETNAKRVSAVKNYLFHTLRNVSEGLVEQEPGCLVSFCHQSLLDYVDEGANLSSLAAGRHISIRVPSDLPHGIFKSLPASYPDSAALARRLVDQVNRHHGVALRQFLSYVTGQLVSDPKALNGFVSDRIKAFRKHAAGDRNDHCEAIVNDTFALAYAAGRIAQKAGILPSDWRIGSAVMRTYRDDLCRPATLRSFNDVLREIAAGEDVVHLDGREHEAGLIQRAQVYVRYRQRGNELLIRPEAINSVVPDFTARANTKAVENVMVKEKGHHTVKRVLPGNVSERVLCFRLPQTK